MRRDLSRLEAEEFDLLIIGGGLSGACALWDATLRGLRAVLIEQRDFGSGTTANSLRIAHGGLRALQQMSTPRLRQAAREQSILFRIAPGMIQPLPCIVPIYRGSTGPSAFRAAFLASRVLTADIGRTYGSPLPAPRVLSIAETLTCFDGFERAELRGGALWYDAQVPEIERLVLAFIISAAERGAAAANYVRARHVIVEQGKVAGAELTDQRTGNNFRLRARMVLNAAGPWCEDLAPVPNGRGSAIPRRWAQGVNLVLNRPALPVAVGIRSRWNSERDPILGGHRYLFMTGWKGVTLAGTSYRFATGAPSLAIQAEELIEEWNAACPSMQLAVQEITQAHLGLLPLRDGVQPGRPTALLDQSAIVEHQGMSGFLTLVSTKFSTARHLAEQAVDKAMVTLGRGRGASPARHVPLTLPGTDAPELDRRTRHAIREEMACTLEDLVLRRLGLGLTAIPPVSLLGRIADTAAEELGWTRREADDEIKRLLVAFFPASVTRAA